MFHILIVDDEKHTRLLLQKVLETEKYHVFSACNGQEALEVMDKNHIDLVILDIMMPVMDGYELTKALRETDNNLPILMVSAKQLPIDKKKGFLAGTDDYITKPIDEEEMLLRIRALLRRAKFASEHKIEFNNITLDYDALTVSKENEIQELPQKEFLLLYKLLSNPGKIFTRIQLMDEIWGPDSDADERTVDVHIKRLREKFSEAESFSIVTVRGLGYRAERSL